jgi:exopolysaccharide biosynthesis polyprenyl glycosylphosphotransferase
MHVLMKRGFDVVFSVSGLIVFAPIMALIAIAIRLDSKGPVLYRQPRIGRGGRIFEVLKFRSMRCDAEAQGAQWARKQDPRATRVGRWLRKFHLDELPQFVNVLRGEMSFVGPRPERPVFVHKLRAQIPFYDARHAILPGVTGWAQIQYEYADSVEGAIRKLEYDLFYMKSQSILFDTVIVLRTIKAVLFGKGR